MWPPKPHQAATPPSNLLSQMIAPNSRGVGPFGAALEATSPSNSTLEMHKLGDKFQGDVAHWGDLLRATPLALRRLKFIIWGWQIPGGCGPLGPPFACHPPRPKAFFPQFWGKRIRGGCGPLGRTWGSHPPRIWRLKLTFWVTNSRGMWPIFSKL